MPFVIALEKSQWCGSMMALRILYILVPVAFDSQLYNANAATQECTNRKNVCIGPGPTHRPLPGCENYVQCGFDNDIAVDHRCQSGTIFDVTLTKCNWDNVSRCNVKACPKTLTPTENPSANPTSPPSTIPTRHPSVTPSQTPSVAPTTSSPTTAYDFLRLFEFEDFQRSMESFVFSSYSAAGTAYPSTMYTLSGMIKSLKEMALTGISYDDPVDGSQKFFKFYLGYEEKHLAYGQANLAAFLANAMVESIAKDTCDEINSDDMAGRFAISNSCGQNGRSYQDEVCMFDEDAKMSCHVDVNMVTTAVSKEGRGPPPFTCRPKTDDNDYSGFWDEGSKTTELSVFSNAMGRLDVEGCCWWGRGVLLTRGTCNIGKLSYFLGKSAYERRGESRFPGVDFCSDPEAICTEALTSEELRWITGMFEWTERIQPYSRDGWTYLNKLKDFVDDGMKDDSFISAVSSIVAGGSHDSTFSLMQTTNQETRKNNFQAIIRIFRFFTSSPTKQPVKTSQSEVDSSPFPFAKFQNSDNQPDQIGVFLSQTAQTNPPTRNGSSPYIVPLKDNSSGTASISYLQIIVKLVLSLRFL